MYFVTNRFFKQSSKSPAYLSEGKRRKVTFDLDNNLVSNAIYFCKKESTIIIKGENLNQTPN